jgi:hypothetical protein
MTRTTYDETFYGKIIVRPPKQYSASRLRKRAADECLTREEELEIPADAAKTLDLVGKEMDMCHTDHRIGVITAKLVDPKTGTVSIGFKLYSDDLRGQTAYAMVKAGRMKGLSLTSEEEYTRTKVLNVEAIRVAVCVEGARAGTWIEAKSQNETSRYMQTEAAKCPIGTHSDEDNCACAEFEYKSGITMASTTTDQKETATIKAGATELPAISAPVVDSAPAVQPDAPRLPASTVPAATLPSGPVVPPGVPAAVAPPAASLLQTVTPPPPRALPKALQDMNSNARFLRENPDILADLTKRRLASLVPPAAAAGAAATAPVVAPVGGPETKRMVEDILDARAQRQEEERLVKEAEMQRDAERKQLAELKTKLDVLSRESADAKLLAEKVKEENRKFKEEHDMFIKATLDRFTPLMEGIPEKDINSYIRKTSLVPNGRMALEIQLEELKSKKDKMEQENVRRLAHLQKPAKMSLESSSAKQAKKRSRDSDDSGDESDGTLLARARAKLTKKKMGVLAKGVLGGDVATILASKREATVCASKENDDEKKKAHKAPVVDSDDSDDEKPTRSARATKKIKSAAAAAADVDDHARTSSVAASAGKKSSAARGEKIGKPNRVSDRQHIIDQFDASCIHILPVRAALNIMAAQHAENPHAKGPAPKTYKLHSYAARYLAAAKANFDSGNAQLDIDSEHGFMPQAVGYATSDRPILGH